MQTKRIKVLKTRYIGFRTNDKIKEALVKLAAQEQKSLSDFLNDLAIKELKIKGVKISESIQLV